MDAQTKALHVFSAFALVSLAILFRLLGIFDMELTEAALFLGKLVLPASSFFGSCWIFGKLIEMILKKSS
jgi:hypothetical protein